MFAPPDFLRMPAFGVDISSDDVRFVELLPHGDEFRLGRHGAIPLAEGIVEMGRIEDPDALVKVLKRLAKEEGIRFANIALPEEQSFLTQMEVPRVSHKDLRGAVEIHLEEYVPIPPQDAAFDHIYIDEDAEKTTAIVGVLPESIVEQYVDIFNAAGITPKALEFQSHAMARAMFDREARGTYMGIDIGRDETHVFIVHDREVHFSALLDFGGGVITNSIATKLEIPVEEADKLKARFGLVASADHPGIREAILHPLSTLRERIMQYFTYWQHRHDGGHAIEEVLLTGGGANLTGIVEYLGQGVNARFCVANPWINVCDFETYIPPITHKESQGYTSAIGLALRGDYLD
jgi:type IV pilus assembly protein PilM